MRKTEDSAIDAPQRPEKRKLPWAKIVVSAILIGIFALPILDPLRRPTTLIQSWLLRKAPYGSDYEHLVRLVESQGWELHSNYTREEEPTEEMRSDVDFVDGKTIVRIYLGGYQGIPFGVDVDCDWGFNVEGKLVDLNVRKMIDGL